MKRHFTLLTLVFFLWGVITSMNSAIVLFFSHYFAISWQQAMLITVVFYIAPFIVCLPCAKLMAHLGYRKVLQGALLLSAIGAMILARAVQLPTFVGALAGMLVLAAGVSVLQVVANPYLAAISAPTRQIGNLSLASAVNSLGTSLAPAGIALLFKFSPHQQPVSGLFYGLASAALTLLAGTIFLKLPTVRTIQTVLPITYLWKNSEIRLTILAIFVYVGVEVSLASNLTPYLIDAGGWMPKMALSLLSFYWGGALIGRLVFGFVAKPSCNAQVFRASAFSGLVLTALAIALNNRAGGIALLMAGIANAVMYPVIFGYALARWSSLANLLAAAMVMAGIGGAILPWVQAWMVGTMSLRLSFLLPMMMYLLLMLWGERALKPETPPGSPLSPTGRGLG